METFYIGQIFENEYPSEAAEWCNERQDCYIDEIETVADIRRFEIKLIPAPSAEEVKQRQISEIKAQLTAIDLKTIRALRAGEIEYLAQYETQAIELRQQLKDLGVSDDSELD